MKRIQGVLEIGPLVFLYVDICDEIHSYTDAHDVDESVATIGNFGGHFNVGEVSVVGMLMRYLDSYTTKNLSFVASSDIRN